MKVRRPYAFCCIEGGGRPSGCMCSNPDHGYAVVDVRAMLPGDEPLSGVEGETVPGGCTCEVAFGQNPDCPAHGRGTAWRTEHDEADMREAPYGSGIAQPSTTGETVPGDEWAMVPRDLTYHPAIRAAGWKHVDTKLFHGLETQMQAMWDAMLKAASPKQAPVDQGEVACRFVGVSYTAEDLATAQRAACAIVPYYGDGAPGEQEAAKAGKLWNDHPAVQGALRALYEVRSAISEEIERLRHVVWTETQSVTWEADETEETKTRRRVCAERRQQWPGSDEECEHDGSCHECDHDMAVEHETAVSKAVRAAGQRILAALSPSSPVEGEER